MTVVDKIRDEKLEYDINRQAAKITALSSGKTEKYEYLTSEEILPFNWRQIIFSFRKSFSDTASLEFSNKKDELKQIEGIFPKTCLLIWLLIN